MKEFTVTKNTRLKDFTDETYPQGSIYFSRLLRAKEIRVNGVKVAKDCEVKSGDVISYYTTPAQESKQLFFIRYEDENVLVVDKDDGVNAEAVFAALASEREVYFIHRLDRNTRGLMVFAKTKEAERALLSAFKHRRVEKYYEALCFGYFSKDHEVLTAYLKKDAKQSLVKVTKEPNGGEKIVTEYRVKRRFSAYTLIEVCLHTGKTHQIRAHLAYVGCPVVGDEKYGDSVKNKSLSRTRQCLIAKRIVFHLEGKLSYLNEREFLSGFSLED